MHIAYRSAKKYQEVFTEPKKADSVEILQIIQLQK